MLSLLPFETIRAVLKYLTTADLLQCQLVNKQWNSASVELLYSTVTINTAVKPGQYIRTLSSSPQLAVYLKRIDIQEFLKKTRIKLLKDHGLLTAIIQHCPNLIVINGRNLNTSFWNRIGYAGSLGQLSHIQVLPLPAAEDIESYIYTILHFKNSLTHICIKASSDFGYDLKEMEAYKILLDDISEFKNLQHLTLKYPSNKQINCFDALIEDCSQLKEFSIELYYPKKIIKVTEDENLIHPNLDVHPRPDIGSLTCNWQSINNQNQLEYVIHKFSNLQSLKFNCSSFGMQADEIYIPSSSIVEFLRYAIIIPHFNIEFTLTDQNIKDVWTKLIDINDIYRDLIIDYYYSDIKSMIVRMDEAKTVIRFPVYFHAGEYHATEINFLSKAGSLIRSLEIDRGVKFGNNFGLNKTRDRSFNATIEQFNNTFNDRLINRSLLGLLLSMEQ